MTFEEMAIYAIAAGLICIMLLLVVDIARKGNKQLYPSVSQEAAPSFKAEKVTLLVEETVIAAAEAVTPQEKPLVYPFYVDCSQDLVKPH